MGGVSISKNISIFVCLNLIDKNGVPKKHNLQRVMGATITLFLFYFAYILTAY
jgi:hypothetical protein